VQYQPPYGPPGAIDPNASYINGDPTIGRQGSVPPAAAFEYPQREIVNLIANAHQVPTDQDLNQMTRAVRDGKLIYCLDSGPLNTVQVVNLTPPITTYTQGLTLHVLVGHTVTGPTTIAIGQINPTAIKRRDGAELQANDMVAGQIATLVCDGTYFQLQNMGADGAVGGTTTLHNVDIPYVHDTGALDPNWTDPKQITKNHVIGLYSPVLPDIHEGRTVEVKLDQIIKGPTDFAPNNFPVHPVAHPDGSPIQDGDGVPNQIWLLVFDSVQWQLLDVFNSGSTTVPAAAKTYDGRSLQLAPAGTAWEVAGGSTASLHRVPSLNTNTQVWTFSTWLKAPFGMPGVGDNVISAGDEGGSWWGCSMFFMLVAVGPDANGNNTMSLSWNSSVSSIAGFQTYQNTPSGYTTTGNLEDNKWHHFMVVADGAYMSAYIDGVLRARGVTGGANSPWNSTNIQVIGSWWSCTGSPLLGSPAGLFGGCKLRFAECIGIDGQAIPDFTKFVVNNNGILVPQDPSEIAKLNFGPNGFYLNWSNATDVSPTGLGKDMSGNNNNWTLINMDLSHLQTDFPGKQQT
jgi:hypothetical protein